jgi:formiminotetrahydrofolate cyclodeaminase
MANRDTSDPAVPGSELPLAGVPVGELPVAELLDALAARTPSPGGGAAAGVACALAAALVQMTASFGSGSEAGALGRRAQELRGLALRLADEDLTAYAPVLEALALPSEDPQRQQRLAGARARASEPPLGIAQAAAEVAELGLAAARASTSHLVGDALTGVVLAEAASRAAAELVTINLLGDRDDPRHPLAGQVASRASEARKQIFAIGRVDL